MPPPRGSVRSRGKRPSLFVAVRREEGRDGESETIDSIMHAHFPIHTGFYRRGVGEGRTNGILSYVAPVERNTNEVTLSGWSPAKTVH